METEFKASGNFQSTENTRNEVSSENVMTQDFYEDEKVVYQLKFDDQSREVSKVWLDENGNKSKYVERVYRDDVLGSSVSSDSRPDAFVLDEVKVDFDGNRKHTIFSDRGCVMTEVGSRMKGNASVVKDYRYVDDRNSAGWEKRAVTDGVLFSKELNDGNNNHTIDVYKALSKDVDLISAEFLPELIMLTEQRYNDDGTLDFEKTINYETSFGAKN